MKGIFLILFIFISLNSFSQFYGLNRNYAAPYPAYEDNGGITGSGTQTISVAYPSTVNADDILIIQVLNATTGSWATPTDWTLIYQEGANSSASNAYFWKRAAGTESGTVGVTLDEHIGAGHFGVMSRYSNCVTSGTPYEDATGVAVTNTITPTIPALTATGLRLAVGLVNVEDNITLTSETTYTEAYQLKSTYGGDANLALFTQEVESGSVVSDVLSLASPEYAGTLGILLIPE